MNEALNERRSTRNRDLRLVRIIVRIIIRVHLHRIIILHPNSRNAAIWDLILHPPAPQHVHPAKTGRRPSSDQPRRSQPIPIVPCDAVDAYLPRPSTCAGRKDLGVLFRLPFCGPCHCRTINRFLKSHQMIKGSDNTRCLNVQ